MDLFSYAYNFIFVLFFAIALSSCFTTYGVTKERPFRWFGILLLAYIFDSALVAICSALNMKYTVSTAYFMMLALFTGVEIYILTRTIYAMFDCEKRMQAVFFAAGAVLCAGVGILLSGDLGWFLDMSAFSFAMLAVSGLYWRMLSQAKDKPVFERAVKYRKLMLTMGIFSALSILENLLYLGGASAVIDRLFPVYRNHISFFCDGFSLLLAVWLVLFSRKEQDIYISQQVESTLEQRMHEFQAREQEKQKIISKEQVEAFGRYYNLTEREIEILHLVLEGKSNPEIGQTLYITIGTVKTHIHSIFNKLEVSRRGQLMSRFVNHSS